MMRGGKTFAAVGVRYLKIPAAISPAEKKTLLSLLNPVERRCYRSLKAPGRRWEYLAGHALLRRVMNRDGCHGRYFNLSHSGIWVACASASCPVGVDVERVRERPRAGDIVAKWFSPQEKDLFRTCAPPHRALLFTRLWVLKEALFKMGAFGLKDILRKSHFQIAAAGRVKSLLPSWQFSLHTLPGGYVLGLAYATDHAVVPVIERVEMASLA
jgi:hypothetical protein